MATPSRQPDNPSNAAPNDRAFLGINFLCANAYARAMKLPSGEAYLGRCPRCAREVRFRVGEGGMDARFFNADCGLRFTRQ